MQEGRPVSGYVAALAATWLGDRDGMYRWLEYTFRTRDWQMVAVNADPEFAPYRGEPRFQALIRQAGMRP